MVAFKKEAGKTSHCPDCMFTSVQRRFDVAWPSVYWDNAQPMPTVSAFGRVAAWYLYELMHSFGTRLMSSSAFNRGKNELPALN
jgi:hypothetical protein